MQKLSAVVLLCLVLLSASVWSTAGADTPDLDKAKSTYNQFCSKCHGFNMVNAGTSTFDLRIFPLDKPERFYESVTKGRGSMPAWGDLLTAEELDLLWYYVATRAGTQPLPEPEKSSELETIEPDTLTACLARNGGIMSGWRSAGGIGLDYALSQRLADELGLNLEVVWFESEQEKESSPMKDTYAMLSYGLCDLVPGNALYAPALNNLAGRRASLPRWQDRPEYIEKNHHVSLQPILMSAPYMRAEFAVVLRAPFATREIADLNDLDGLRVGIEQGTLTGMISLKQASIDVVSKSITFNPGPSFLWKMEAELFDAALVSVAAYDFHKRQNPISDIALSDYRHSLGFNLSFAALATSPDLIAAIDQSFEKWRNSGELAQLAAENGLTYASPQKPHIQAAFTMRDFHARK